MIDELSNKGFSVTEFRGQLAVSVNDKVNIFYQERKSLKGKFLATMLLLEHTQDSLER